MTITVNTLSSNNRVEGFEGFGRKQYCRPKTTNMKHEMPHYMKLWFIEPTRRPFDGAQQKVRNSPIQFSLERVRSAKLCGVDTVRDETVTDEMGCFVLDGRLPHKGNEVGQGQPSIVAITVDQVVQHKGCNLSNDPEIASSEGPCILDKCLTNKPRAAQTGHIQRSQARHQQGFLFRILSCDRVTPEILHKPQ